MIDATGLLRLYGRYRRRQLAAHDPAAVQRAQLMALLHEARNTRFGKEHDFAAISGVEDFQKRVRLRRYEDFWQDYWKDAFPRVSNISWPGTIPFFAVTSGTTTGVTKYIPVSKQMVRSNVKAAADLLVHHLANRPNSRILGGRNFMLGGSTDLTEQAPGIYSGDVSGIAVAELPWWAQPRYFPPRDLALLADWEEKIDRMARGSLDQDIRTISGTPSWLLLFIDRLADITGIQSDRLVDFYPNLELVAHGGVNFAPYRARFDALLQGSHAETREGYAASEGFMANADRGPGEGMRLVLDHGLFYEFIPLEELESDNPTRHWIGTVETGVNYAIALSTCAGAWAYIVGDTVSFVDRDIPRILVTGRVSYSLSAFGEHLIDHEIEEAVAKAADAIGTTVTDYSVGALHPKGRGDRGGHLYVVEFAERITDKTKLDRFTEVLDTCLCDTNEDYQSHRGGDFGMNAPKIRAVAPGSFADWMKHRGQLGGQHKVPRIITRQDLFDDLLDFTGGPVGN